VIQEMTTEKPPTESSLAARLPEWNQAWKAFHYEACLTADGSPTLRWLNSTKEIGETMHHSGGAYSETQLIYGDPWRDCLDHGGSSAFSLGLGLGYNEFLVAAESLIWNLPPSMIRLLSLEADGVLTQAMLDCVHDRRTPLSEIFFAVMDLYEKKYLLPPGLLQLWLREAYELKKWEIRGALTADSPVGERFHCIFYDAFSSKTSPELWTEEFLRNFFLMTTAPQCWVSTYACTGNLKRALKQNHFTVTLREGFHGKRQSTLASR
jgi:hypothetical protein